MPGHPALSSPSGRASTAKRVVIPGAVDRGDARHDEREALVPGWRSPPARRAGRGRRGRSRARRRAARDAEAAQRHLEQRLARSTGAPKLRRQVAADVDAVERRHHLGARRALLDQRELRLRLVELPAYRCRPARLWAAIASRTCWPCTARPGGERGEPSLRKLAVVLKRRSPRPLPLHRVAGAAQRHATKPAIRRADLRWISPFLWTGGDANSPVAGEPARQHRAAAGAEDRRGAGGQTRRRAPAASAACAARLRSAASRLDDRAAIAATASHSSSEGASRSGGPLERQRTSATCSPRLGSSVAPRQPPTHAKLRAGKTTPAARRPRRQGKIAVSRWCDRLFHRQLVFCPELARLLDYRNATTRWLRPAATLPSATRVAATRRQLGGERRRALVQPFALEQRRRPGSKRRLPAARRLLRVGVRRSSASQLTPLQLSHRGAPPRLGARVAGRQPLALLHQFCWLS